MVTGADQCVVLPQQSTQTTWQWLMTWRAQHIEELRLVGTAQHQREQQPNPKELSHENATWYPLLWHRIANERGHQMFQCVLRSNTSRQAASKDHPTQADAEQPEPHEAAKGTSQLAEGSKVTLLADHKDEVALVVDNRCGELFATQVRTAKAANADLCLTRCQL